MRLDAFLVQQGLCRSRATAAEAIRDGQVTVDGRVAKKPSDNVTGGETVTVNENRERYVSRGGYKLEGALASFGIDVAGLTCVHLLKLWEPLAGSGSFLVVPQTEQV